MSKETLSDCRIYSGSVIQDVSNSEDDSFGIMSGVPALSTAQNNQEDIGVAINTTIVYKWDFEARTIYGLGWDNLHVELW
jgi:hypothetical protein